MKWSRNRSEAREKGKLFNLWLKSLKDHNGSPCFFCKTSSGYSLKSPILLRPGPILVRVKWKALGGIIRQVCKQETSIQDSGERVHQCGADDKHNCDPEQCSSGILTIAPNAWFKLVVGYYLCFYLHMLQWLSRHRYLFWTGSWPEPSSSSSSSTKKPWASGNNTVIVSFALKVYSVTVRAFEIQKKRWEVTHLTRAGARPHFIVMTKPWKSIDDNVVSLLTKANAAGWLAPSSEGTCCSSPAAQRPFWKPSKHETTGTAKLAFKINLGI